MKQELLTEVLLEMREYVDNGQLKQLEGIYYFIITLQKKIHRMTRLKTIGLNYLLLPKE